MLIDGKKIFDVPIKKKEEAYEKIISISKNNDYTTGNLLDWVFFKALQINCNRFTQTNQIRKP